MQQPLGQCMKISIKINYFKKDSNHKNKSTQNLLKFHDLQNLTTQNLPKFSSARMNPREN